MGFWNNVVDCTLVISFYFRTFPDWSKFSLSVASKIQGSVSHELLVNLSKVLET